MALKVHLAEKGNRSINFQWLELRMQGTRFQSRPLVDLIFWF